MEASSRFRLDLGSSWADLLTVPDLSVSRSSSGQGRVLHGLLSTDEEFIGDSCGPSPVDEVLQDSIWSPPAVEGVGGYPGWFGMQQLDEGLTPSARKLSSSSWCDDLVQPQQLTSTEVVEFSDLLQVPEYVGYDGKHSAAYSSSSSIDDSLLAPIDERFEFGDVSNVGIAEQMFGFEDEVTSQHVADYTDTQQALYQKVDSTISNETSKQASFILGDIDGALELFLQDSLKDVPTIFDPESIVPVHESSVLPLDTLDGDDSLHDAESVCQLLRALDATTSSTGFLRGVSPALNHFSPEEVESVLSRDPSSDNLAAMDVAWEETEIGSEATVECSAPSPYTILTSLSSPVGTRTVISVVPSSCSTIVGSNSVSGVISASSCYIPVSQPFLTIEPSTTIVGSNFAVSPVTSVVGQEFPAASSVKLVSTSPISSSIGQEYKKDPLMGKQTSGSRSARSNGLGYNEVLIERRQRKKEQNKSAALKYRQRKREEKGHALTEVEELEQENDQLKKRAEELAKEIGYLRGLLEEITKP